jgi:protein-S-isoprenylcysteine O-methyltransferase Ste14
MVLLVIGMPMWLTGVRAVMRAYNGDRLVTSGVFGFVRHPVYSAWIVFNIPAIALLCRSWPLLLTPVVAYVVFKLGITTEDDYLEQRFGQEYRDYRARVNEVIPIPRLPQR